MVDKIFSKFSPGPDFERAREQIATDFESVDIDLTNAGVNVDLNIGGDYLYLDPDPGGIMAAGGVSIAGFVSIELNNQYASPKAPFFAQAGFAIQALFTRLKLNWPAQPGKKARIMYSTGARVVPTNSQTINGVVSIVDSGLSRTAGLGAFLGTSAIGPVGAQFSGCQLWNPAGNNKNLIIEAVSFSAGAAEPVMLGDFNAAYGTLLNSRMNKMSGAVGPTAEVRATTNAALAAMIQNTALVYSVGASVVQTINFKEPVIVPPGRGFVVGGQALNTLLVTNFEWFEQ